ncbi:hypothetical protein [Streptomyces sp. MNP-20]|uniref:hypothetical protein n=1 Tax=Streptomyces sp. MNP-20 TaxID=2721165 RepID=UPI0015579B69|nr:hypothetical protein [Streptomyces sp. MNP-20]
MTAQPVPVAVGGGIEPLPAMRLTAARRPAVALAEPYPVVLEAGGRALGWAAAPARQEPVLDWGLLGGCGVVIVSGTEAGRGADAALPGLDEVWMRGLQEVLGWLSAVADEGTVWATPGPFLHLASPFPAEKIITAPGTGCVLPLLPAVLPGGKGLWDLGGWAGAMPAPAVVRLPRMSRPAVHLLRPSRPTVRAGVLAGGGPLRVSGPSAVVPSSLAASPRRTHPTVLTGLSEPARPVNAAGRATVWTGWVRSRALAAGGW